MLRVPMPPADILLDNEPFRLDDADRLIFELCLLLAIGLYELELCDLKPSTKKGTQRLSSGREKSGKMNTNLPFPILKSLSEQARRMDDDDSFGCDDNIRLFGFPKMQKKKFN